MAKLMRLRRIKEILDSQYREDIKLYKTGKTRSSDFWLNKLNYSLPNQMKIRNYRELSSIFRIFKFKKGISERRFEGCIQKIVFYRYLGGFKNDKRQI